MIIIPEAELFELLKAKLGEKDARAIVEELKQTPENLKYEASQGKK